jgi:putative spermidine/putrescine transport system substrate-binding protein
MNQAFQHDCLEILAARLERGEISRRRFIQAATMVLAGTPFALHSTRADAAGKTLVFVNWGGDALRSYDQAYGQAFLRQTGVTVRQDGSGPTEGAITAQFKSGKPTWDIVDADPFSAISLGKRGMIEPIDYQVVDRSRMRNGFGWEYAASTYFYSYVIAYDASRFGGRAPAGMADFFDVRKFPGKRSMYKWGAGMWEAALLADGVAADKLYPLDLKRAHEKIAGFRDHVVSYWGGGADSQQILLNGDASMALIWSTRASVLESDSNGQLRFIWDQGLISPGAMAVIRNNPAGRDTAMNFIASAQDPHKQLIAFELMGQGPANPATDALIPADKKRINPMEPANAARQIVLNMAWYADHYGEALDAYTRIISA